MTLLNPFATLVWIIPLAIVLGIILRASKYSTAARPGLLARWTAMTGRQRLAAVAIVAAFGTAIIIGGQITRAEREAILRQQFHIPEGLAFDHFETQNKMRISPRIAGIVRFDDARYEEYEAGLGNAALWSPVPFTYTGRGDITPVARGTGFMWYELPYPGRAGEISIRWGSNVMDEVQYVRNGRYFCTAIIAETAAAPAVTTQQPPRHSAKACRNVTRKDKAVRAIMLAVLDRETKTLYATIY